MTSGCRFKIEYLLFTRGTGKAQLRLGTTFAVMAAEEVIPIQRISIRTVCRHIQVNHKTCKDEPQPNVGDQDIALVVIIQAPCRDRLPKKGRQRGNHEGGPACGQVLISKSKKAGNLTPPTTVQKCRCCCSSESGKV